MIGCGSSVDIPADRPATHPVSGTVTYNGSPLSGATVTFRPSQGATQGGYATTDENGAFTLTTFETGDGAQVGSYLVMIKKQEVTEGDPSYGDPDSPNYGKEPPPGAESKTVDLIPTKYANTKTSGLSADVKESENTFSFDLTD